MERGKRIGRGLGRKIRYIEEGSRMRRGRGEDEDEGGGQRVEMRGQREGE
jgi:hypothetical protein